MLLAVEGGRFFSSSATGYSNGLSLLLLGQKKVDENSQPSNLAEGDGDGDTNGVNAVSLKSSLKKRASTVTVTVSVAENKCDEVEPEPVHQSARRSVHWTDVTGGELCEIREFEPSEHSDSDDEFENNTGKTCSCTIM
ncbi:putative light-harvesting complex-like protein OHP2 [Helianthus annuus]|nr:putative light-harvesting complex-like protein OHP2 [Helianthus annuus]